MLDNGNIYRVFNGPTAATKFNLPIPSLLTYIFTYHWNDGKGMKPGTVALVHDDGTIYGPWQTEGKPGQGGVPNAYWECVPMVELKAGSYTIIDSNPATWAQNAGTSGAGFAKVKAVPRLGAAPR